MSLSSSKAQSPWAIGIAVFWALATTDQAAAARS
jgi:hypothetical protein